MDQQTALILGKLNEQFQQNASSDQLLTTLRQLEAALLAAAPAQRKSLGTAKVAVVLPAASPIAAPSAEALQPPATGSAPAAEAVNTPGAKATVRQSPEINFDPLLEIPTLAHQQAGRELNEVMGTAHSSSSLNDTLKTGVLEVGHLLKDAPIRDLKKAIGINDRFVFITELFRGDENAFERSLRTINAFRIYAEAEYWIERELKAKLGWDTDTEVARHFYQLVRRRFS